MSDPQDEGTGIVFYDPTDPAEPQRSMRDHPNARAYFPEKADEEDLRGPRSGPQAGDLPKYPSKN